jgi:hypothetical protein
MKYSIELPGFEEQNLSIEVRFPFRPRIWVNKKIAQSKIKKWNELALRRDDGLTSVITILPKFPDPVPELEMDDEIYRAVAPFTWGERILAFLPILLIAVSVTDLQMILYGVGLGLLAIYINFWVLRLQDQKLERNLMVIAITAAVAVIYFLIYLMKIRSLLGM